MLKFSAIKTDAGFFIKVDSYTIYWDSFYFDGKNAAKTFHPNYYRIDKIPKIIEEEIFQPNTNYRFELIDKSLKNSKIPLVLPAIWQEAADENNYSQWTVEADKINLKPLYELKSDSQPKIKKSIPFEFTIVMEMDKIKEYGGFNYPVQRSRWESEGFIDLTHRDVQHELVDTILFPDIILPARTSKLTSHQTYKIIRRHVQTNINPKYSVITSDYDFCFTVQKRVPLAEKVAYQRDISSLNSRKPKYVTDYRTVRTIPVFEMTHSGDGGNYKGYTPIKPFEGKNIEDLKNNIDNFLNELISKINEPLVDCKCCKGTGVILE